MGTSYLVDKNMDDSILSLIRVCDNGDIEYLKNGEWLPSPHAFDILMGEIGDAITPEEARDIAPRFGGTIELDDAELSERS